MINNNMIDFNNICDLIQDAHGAGYTAYIIINGEYYNINPDTIPAATKDTIKDLPF